MSFTLIEEFAKGDAAAAVEFYKEYSPKIFSYLSKRLPAKEDAEDLTNDVFLDAIDGISFLRKKTSVMAWLYKIARNNTVDFYRKRKIKSILISRIPFFDVIASEVSQPEFQYEKNKIRDRIEKTFYSLSHKYQKILRLHYEEQVPIKEMALIFNMSFKATESLLFRARQKFKKEYERE